MIFCFIRVTVYSIIISGWSSNSIYALIGSLRSVAQTISYEIRFILIVINVLIFIERFQFIDLYKFQIYCSFFYILLPIRIIIYVRILAELNRTPFDLSEGESELVSGFNIEYIRGRFALIFISEYGNILFINYLLYNIIF